MATNTQVSISNIVLFGGINYGLGKVAAFYPVARNGKKRESDDFLIDLPGTKTEIEHIYNLLVNKTKVNFHTGDEASKNRFKTYSGKKPNIIHIATHGFFHHSEQEANIDALLLNSGLYFAGAQNTIWKKDTEILKDNGILTSHEISSLDLRGLQLAVLSACETGLGHINNEGVFGLQRGFKQASAKSILMSLWKVDDEATELLMNIFYKNLIAGQNLYEALEQARTEVRKTFPDPKDWAAFILIDANYKLKIQ